MLIHTQQLNNDTLNALKRLLHTCKQTDGHAISFYRDLLSQPRPKPQTLLSFKNEQLIGFAAVFFFEHNIGEISLFVDPKHRKQGIGRELLNTLLPLIQQDRPVETLLFSTPHSLHEATLIQRGFQYQGSEYEMQREIHQTITQTSNQLTIRQATAADVKTLCYIDSQCFPTSPSFSEARFQTILSHPDHTLFIAIYGDTIIGKAHITWHEKTAYLSDLATLPTMQRRGFGRALITHCMNHVLTHAQTSITLSVETHNKNALHLYQDLDFCVSNAIDYWSCPFSHLYPTDAPSVS